MRPTILYCSVGAYVRSVEAKQGMIEMRAEECENTIRRLLETSWRWTNGEVELEELQKAIQGAERIGAGYTPPHRLVSPLYCYIPRLLEEIEARVARGKRSLRAKLRALTPIGTPQRETQARTAEEREADRALLNARLARGSRPARPIGCISGQTRKPGSHRSGRHS